MHRTQDILSFEPALFYPDSGKGCRYPGYDEFNPTSWGSECAPDKLDWIAISSGECRRPGKYGNVFWNCSDIELTGDSTGPDSTSASEGKVKQSWASEMGPPSYR